MRTIGKKHNVTKDNFQEPKKAKINEKAPLIISKIILLSHSPIPNSIYSI
jgi:hypothetical protein